GELIPGTDDYFYYHCLFQQGRGDFGAAAGLLAEWGKEHENSARRPEMWNRQVLLNFEADPKVTWEHLGRVLGLNLGYERFVPEDEMDLPATLNGDLLSVARLTDRALRLNNNTLAGFRDAALPSLAVTELSQRQLGQLLTRLTRPDVPNLSALVVRDLENRRKNDLGSRPVHEYLTLAQLEECARLRPSLLRGSKFVEAVLRRLHPSNDSNWRSNAIERDAYLERLERFAARLSPAFNSLKAHVLYHRLEHDLGQGNLDRADLVAYLRLPRSASYVRSELMRAATGANTVNLGQEYSTGLGPIGNDEGLVRACVAHFLVGDTNTAAFDETLREDYLRRLFAETKLLAGVGQRARWYELLDSASAFEALEKRVELNFARQQQHTFGALDPVTLEVDVKNIPRLLVKVFEIDTFNYYRTLEREVDAGITLDGLVSQEEFTLEFDSPALQRVRRSIELPNLAKPGVYVVELVGGGVSSRAVVHKGELRFTERLTAAGHALRVLDEAGAAHSDAAVWFGGREYTANEQGEIYLPFSTDPEARSLVLVSGERASLGRFDHRGEEYALEAGFYLPRESLLAGELAQVVLRPTLTLNGQFVATDLMQDPVLTIRSTSLDGIASSREVEGSTLSVLVEALAEFQVPEGLREISFELRGHLKPMTGGEEQQLVAHSQSFRVNYVDSTDRTESPLLSRSSAGYALDVLGKDGEPRAGRVVTLVMTLADYTDDLTVRLQTDAVGRLTLGQLPGVTALKASGFPSEVGAWPLDTDRRTYPLAISGVVGEVLRLPLATASGGLSPRRVSLVEKRAGVVYSDGSSKLAEADGFLELRGLAAGDYTLHLVDADVTIDVRVTEAEWNRGWATGETRWLPQEGRGDLQLGKPQIEGEELVLRLRNANAATRVHLIASRYLPSNSAFELLESRGFLQRLPLQVALPDSEFASGRALSDEVRYVLDRRLAPRFPGNMLRRPGMLLNPWSIEDTDTVIGVGGGSGGHFGGRLGGDRNLRAGGRGREGQRDFMSPGVFANLDFLPQAAKTVYNLRPDAEGVIRVPLSALGEGQHVTVLATDLDDTLERRLLRSEIPLVPRTRVLRDALGAAALITEQRRIEFLDTGAAATFEQLQGSELELIDSLAAVFQLFQTLGADASLQDFKFLLGWPELEASEKLELYSEFACHELDFFLFQKDRPFFNEIVRPTLANKIELEFMDEWLLGRELGGYLEPWRFGRLNVVERILLGQRLGDAGIEKHVLDLVALVNPSGAGARYRFDRMLGADELSGDDWGLLAETATRSVERQSEKKDKAERPAETLRGLGYTGDMEEAEEEPDFNNDSPFVPSLGFFYDEASLASTLELRANMQQLYRNVATTRRLVETYYRGHRIGEMTYGLVPAHAFWGDFVAHRNVGGTGAFVSGNLDLAAGNATEMLLALAVLELPFVSPEHSVSRDGTSVTLKAGGPLLMLRRELSVAERNTEAAPLLASHSYHSLASPTKVVDGRQVDAYVTEEFVAGEAYGCKVVLTNPTSTARSLEVFLQIPEGALPVQGGFTTRAMDVTLGGFGTQTIDYAFYFPRPGQAAHYPAQVSESERIIASSEARSLPVVARATVVDTTSWEYVSQNGSLADVLGFLAASNLGNLDLERIAWRMDERAAFEAILEHLRSRHVFDTRLWAYGLEHRDAASMAEYLGNSINFISRCGPVLDSRLLTIEPIERRSFQRMEFEPLILARSHAFAGGRDMQNASAAQHYAELLTILTYRSSIGPEDRMELTYSLLLQNRIEEALGAFDMIDATELTSAGAGRLQYDYMRCYMAFFGNDPEEVRALANSYAEFPLGDWRERFAAVVSQLDEVQGSVSDPSEDADQASSQGALAAGDASIGLEILGDSIRLEHTNLEACELRFYPMDVELLFSSHPFGEAALDAFGFVRPASRSSVDLSGSVEGRLDMPLPAAYANSNVVVEVRAAGIVRRAACYSNTLRVRLMEGYGQLQVRDAKNGAALSRTYVKVFVRLKDGSVRFHKDGYTDLRGRFDYASLSGEGSGTHERFAILVMDDERGAIVREVEPPQR
ncbi:MAG: hypothetical protein ACI9K5_002542, partial [Gammaproteobacteria bacterium]